MHMLSVEMVYVIRRI